MIFGCFHFCNNIKGYPFRGFKSMWLEFDISQTKLWNQFFSLRLKVITLRKMGRLTITQCIKIIKAYHKNGESASATYRALKRGYGLHNRPTTQAIGRIMKIFEETGAVKNIACGLLACASSFHWFCWKYRYCKWKCCQRFECVDSSSFSGIRTALRHIMANFPFRSSPTSI